MRNFHIIQNQMTNTNTSDSQWLFPNKANRYYVTRLSEKSVSVLENFSIAQRANSDKNCHYLQLHVALLQFVRVGLEFYVWQIVRGRGGLEIGVEQRVHQGRLAQTGLA